MSGEDEKKTIGFVMDVFSSCGSMEYATLEEQVIRIYDMPKTTCNITIRKKDPSNFFFKRLRKFIDDSGIRIRLDEYVLKHAISKHHIPGTPREFISDELTIILDEQVP